MESDYPGLFEMAVEAPRHPARPDRGRNRETWACTTTAMVTVLDESAIKEALLQELESAYVIGEAAEGTPDAELPRSPLDQVAWLTWPTSGLDHALEVDALLVLSAASAVTEKTRLEGTLSCEVTVKLRRVEALRQPASAACPEAADLIANSFAVAWQHATDPFAPLRSIPGIEWTPGSIETRRIPARAGRSGESR